MTRTDVAGFLLVAMAWTGGSLIAQSEKDLAGAWHGTLRAGASELRLILHVEAKEGGLRAKLDSVDQGAKGLGVDTIELAGRKVTFRMRRLGASFSGALSKDGKSIQGAWKQGAEMPLTFKLGDGKLKLSRPQHPKRPFPYDERQVRFSHDPKKSVSASFAIPEPGESGGPVTLSGTLTMPRGKGPFPAVVLVSGSGPQDRDETLMGHKPFLVIADYLTRRGVAVLRYDDRGVGKSTGRFRSATSDDFADDAEAAVRFLRTVPKVRRDAVGIAGHSEGGLIAPIVAARYAGVGFIVLMAGPGVTGVEILELQGQLIAKASGASDAMLAEQKRVQGEMFAIVKASLAANEGPAALRKKLRDRLTAALGEDGEGSGKVDREIRQLMSPWMQRFLFYDPRSSLRKVQCPVLAINGELDLQVDAGQNLPEIEKALRAAGNRSVEIVRLPGLNHLFQKCATGAPSEYSKIEQTFSPKALKVIAEFIGKR